MTIQKKKKSTTKKSLIVTTNWIGGFKHKLVYPSINDKTLEYEIKRLNNFKSLKSFTIEDQDGKILHSKKFD